MDSGDFFDLVGNYVQRLWGGIVMSKFALLGIQGSHCKPFSGRELLKVPGNVLRGH
jgi:hypothetical protein